jgi:hypothetical protein
MGRRLTSLIAALSALPSLALGQSPEGPPNGPTVDQPGRLPESAGAAPDRAYDERLLSAFASAQSFRGPLEGGWTVADDAGDLYSLQLTDGHEGPQGAWRDLRRAGSASLGLIDSVERMTTGLAIRFGPPGEAPVELTLGGDLKGELRQGDGRRRVTLRKTAP